MDLEMLGKLPGMVIRKRRLREIGMEMWDYNLQLWVLFYT